MTPDDARIAQAPSSPSRARRAPPRLIEGPRDRERIATVVVPDHDDLAVLLADRVVDVIARTTAASGRCVLGLATGSTPLGIYRELIRRHRAGEVDFARVVTFNLDEYYPMPPDSPHRDRKSTRLNSSHSQISYAVFCLKKKKNKHLSLTDGHAAQLSDVLHVLDSAAPSFDRPSGLPPRLGPGAAAAYRTLLSL